MGIEQGPKQFSAEDESAEPIHPEEVAAVTDQVIENFQQGQGEPTPEMQEQTGMVKQEARQLSRFEKVVLMGCLALSMNALAPQRTGAQEATPKPKATMGDFLKAGERLGETQRQNLKEGTQQKPPENATSQELLTFYGVDISSKDARAMAVATFNKLRSERDRSFRLVENSLNKLRDKYELPSGDFEKNVQELKEQGQIVKKFENAYNSLHDKKILEISTDNWLLERADEALQRLHNPGEVAKIQKERQLYERITVLEREAFTLEGARELNNLKKELRSLSGRETEDEKKMKAAGQKLQGIGDSLDDLKNRQKTQ